MSDFYEYWREQQGKADFDQLALCPIGRQFQEHIIEMIFEPLKENPKDRFKIAQAKFLLTEEWHAWRKSLPGLHLRTTQNHRCLNEIYDEYYDSLHLMDLQARPTLDLLTVPQPIVIEKPVPTSPKMVHPPGAILGFEDDERPDNS